MRLDQTQQGDVLVVRPLERSLDAHVAVKFKDSLAQLIEAGKRRVVLDLSHVEFLDSTGLGAVVFTYKRLAGRGTLVLAGVQPAVREVFRLTRMDRVFRIAASLDEAIAQVAQDNGRPGTPAA